MRVAQLHETGGLVGRIGVDRTAQVRRVWVLQDGKPVALPVTPGASDGRHTEVASEKLQPGMQVIVGQLAAAK